VAWSGLNGNWRVVILDAAVSILVGADSAVRLPAFCALLWAVVA